MGTLSRSGPENDTLAHAQTSPLYKHVTDSENENVPLPIRRSLFVLCGSEANRVLIEKKVSF